MYLGILTLLLGRTLLLFLFTLGLLARFWSIVCLVRFIFHSNNKRQVEFKPKQEIVTVDVSKRPEPSPSLPIYEIASAFRFTDSDQSIGA